MARAEEQRKFFHHRELDIELLHAYHFDFAYPPHSHDHYVLGLIERGVQSFTYRRNKYITPPHGLILLNPGEVHTGEPVTSNGFILRSLYPTVGHMETAVYEITGRHQPMPIFTQVRVDDPASAHALFTLHRLLIANPCTLACESAFLTTLAHLIGHYAHTPSQKSPIGREHWAIQQAKSYLETRFHQPIRLNDLATHVALSPYYLLRAFHEAVGMPPHAYLQDVRIRQAQHLIKQNKPIADIAFAVGFSSQSHLTRCFKRIVGLTPGQYARHVQPNK